MTDHPDSGEGMRYDADLSAEIDRMCAAIDNQRAAEMVPVELVTDPRAAWWLAVLTDLDEWIGLLPSGDEADAAKLLHSEIGNQAQRMGIEL